MEVGDIMLGINGMDIEDHDGEEHKALGSVDVLEGVFRHVDGYCLGICMQVCQVWLTVGIDEKLWSNICSLEQVSAFSLNPPGASPAKLATVRCQCKDQGQPGSEHSQSSQQGPGALSLATKLALH